MKTKIVGILVAIMFIIIAFPQIDATEDNEKNNKNHLFGYCYIENIKPGDYDSYGKGPYVGCTTILMGGEGTQTTIYAKKGGEEIAHFHGSQTVLIFLMFGYHIYTETSRTYAGTSFGVLVHET